MAAGLIQVEISGRLADALALSFVAFYPLDYLYISGAFMPATVHFIFFLLVCKVLTARSDRDYTYLKLLAVLELLARGDSFHQPQLFRVSGAVHVVRDRVVFKRRGARLDAATEEPWCVEACARFRAGWRTLAIFLFVGILLMTGALFFVLPRTARAALERFVPAALSSARFFERSDAGENRRDQAEQRSGDAHSQGISAKVCSTCAGAARR